MSQRVVELRNGLPVAAAATPLRYDDLEQMLLDDILALLERGIKRTLRLRSWEDRKERVARRRRELLEAPPPDLDLS